MSGRFAMAALHRFAGKVRAAASVYGTEVMTEGPVSPHLLAAQANSRLYVAIAELDAYAPAAPAAPLRAAFAEGAVDAEIEILDRKGDVAGRRVSGRRDRGGGR